MGSSRMFAAVAVLVVLTGAVVVAAAESSDAALAGLTSFAIDGDTAGPDDWDDLPENLLDASSAEDVCGNGVVDPDQLDGKLDDLDLDALEPSPGNVTAKADLCQVWTATEAVPDGSGGFDVVLYGAWERLSSNGEAVLYWVLRGADEDFLIAFDQSGVSLLRWDGASWVVADVPAAVDYDVAFDDLDAPLFGEFAVRITALGALGVGECETYSTDAVLSRTGNDANAEMQDYAGLGAVEVTGCGTVRIDKVTSPAVPVPSATFGYLLGREGSGDVRPGEPQVSGDLTVPGAPSDEVAGVIAGSDLTLEEPTLPDGWLNESITCAWVDPETGAQASADLSSGGTFTALPGGDTACTLTNVGPPTLTVAKVAQPDDGTEFAFDATVTPSGGSSSFVLESGETETIAVEPGDTVVVSEQALADWATDEVICLGDDDAVIAGAEATLSVDAGERIVCLFVNSTTIEPRQAAIVVAKSAPKADGETFDFTVDGPGASPSSFSLDPPDVLSQTVLVTPDVDGSLYTVAEAGQRGWVLEDLTCVGPGGTTVDVDAAAAFIELEPGGVAACIFENSPVQRSASLTVTKTTVPAGGAGFVFDLTGAGGAPFTLDDGGTREFTELRPGTYRLSEQLSLDWIATGTCSDGTVLEHGRATLTLLAGDDVTCDVVNTRRASFTLSKSAQPQSDQDFTFTSASDGGRGGTVILDDDGDETDDVEAGLFPSSITGPATIPGLWTFTEQAVDGWTVSAIECAGVTVVTQDEAAGTVSVQLDPGQSGACEFINVQDDDGGGGGGAAGTGELADSGFPRRDLAALSVALLLGGMALLRPGRFAEG